METFILNSRTKSESDQIKKMIKEMNLESKIISDEDKEDYGLLKIMMDSKDDELVSREEVMIALKSK